MKHIRHTLLALMGLGSMSLGAQENALARYEYWLTRDPATIQTATPAADGSATLSLDFASLSAGLHSLSFRAVDTGGRLSPTLIRHFVKTAPTTTQDNAPEALEWWTDANLAQRQEQPLQGGVAELNLPTDDLPHGLHRLCWRVRDRLGRYSPVEVRYFMHEGGRTPAPALIAGY